MTYDELVAKVGKADADLIQSHVDRANGYADGEPPRTLADAYETWRGFSPRTRLLLRRAVGREHPNA